MYYQAYQVTLSGIPLTLYSINLENNFNSVTLKGVQLHWIMYILNPLSSCCSLRFAISNSQAVHIVYVICVACIILYYVFTSY